jgi:hypothetical protein
LRAPICATVMALRSRTVGVEDDGSYALDAEVCLDVGRDQGVFAGMRLHIDNPEQWIDVNVTSVKANTCIARASLWFSPEDTAVAPQRGTRFCTRIHEASQESSFDYDYVSRYLAEERFGEPFAQFLDSLSAPFALGGF